MWHINQDQALFLDRDGVINRKIEQGYVLRWSEFEFMPNALSAIAHLSRLFGRIIGVTNQQCVGKRMMLETDLIALLYQMTDCVAQHGGRFDAFYYCPHLAYENCGCRKPAIGMARQAQADYPDIDLKRAIMVGDSVSDLQFGRGAGMQTVFIHHQAPSLDAEYAHLADAQYDSLAAFAADCRGANT